MPDDRLLHKVRNLLSLAENAGTVAEAETARERAEAMMLRHSIDAARLHTTNPSQAEAITACDLTIAAPYAKQKSCILTAVIEVNRVRAVSNSRSLAEGMSATLVGYPSDLHRATMLFTSLLLQASRDVMTARPAAKPYPYRTEGVNSYRASWLLGFASEVRDRLTRLHRQQAEAADAERAGGPGTEVILADRAAAVDARFAELFGDTRRGKARSSGSGRRAGAAAGARADLGQTRVGGGR
jgi:hypothetical protein